MNSCMGENCPPGHLLGLLTSGLPGVNACGVLFFMCIHPRVRVLCISRQDMGQDAELYFQEVLASVEQSAEEGSRGEGGALRGRLQQLYRDIVGEIDAGKRRRCSIENRLDGPSVFAHTRN